ncbi:MAG: hypothetical protein ACYST6_10565 [Planctomycetota bacterium]|jgi:DnaJ-class molecular chaperone
MKRGGYPPGVFEHTKNAPWNKHGTARCDVCALEYFTDTAPDAPLPDDMVSPPHTEHGQEHGLCRSCEDENSRCAACGEWYLEPFSGSWFEPSTVRRCPWCAAEHEPELTRFVQPFMAHQKRERCALCDASTRQRVAFTDGRTVPAANTEFLPLCADCAGLEPAAVLRIAGRLTGYEMITACTACNGRGTREYENEYGHVISADDAPCFMCDGTGREDCAQTCKRCRGTGRTWCRYKHAAVTCDACDGAGLITGRCVHCSTPLTPDDVGPCRACGRPVSHGE